MSNKSEVQALNNSIYIVQVGSIAYTLFFSFTYPHSLWNLYLPVCCCLCVVVCVNVVVWLCVVVSVCVVVCVLMLLCDCVLLFVCCCLCVCCYLSVCCCLCVCCYLFVCCCLCVCCCLSVLLLLFRDYQLLEFAICRVITLPWFYSLKHILFATVKYQSLTLYNLIFWIRYGD